MTKKMNFLGDMREAKTAESVAEAERLPTEKGYTWTKRKLKGTKPNEQALRHGKKPIEKPKQSGKLKSALISQQLHERLEQADQDNNIGVEAVNRGTQTAEAGAAVARDTVSKVRKYGKKFHDRAVKPEVSAEKETLRHVEEEAAKGVKTAATAKTARAGDVTGKAAQGAGKSNAFSRFMQRRNIKQEYAAAKTGRDVGHAASHGLAAKPAMEERVSKVFGKAGEFVKSHAGGIAIGGVFILLLAFLFT